MSSPMVGAHAVGRADAARRRRAEARAGELARAVGIAAVALGERRELVGHAGARRGAGVVELHRLAGTRARPRRDVREVRGLRQDRGRALGVGARRTDPHRDRDAASGGWRARPAAMSVSIAPVDFTWSTSSVERCSFDVLDRVEDQRDVRRVEVALDLHDVDAALADRRRRARRATRVEREHRRPRATSATQAPMPRRTAACDGDSRSIGGHGPRALLRGLPGRDRGGQGRGRQDDGDRRAGHRSGPDGHERADRRGRGQIGAGGVLRRTRRSPTRKPSSDRGCGHGPSPPTTPCSSTSTATVCDGSRSVSLGRAPSTWSPPRCPGMKDILVLGKVKQLEQARRRRPDRARRAGGRPRGLVPPVGPRACSTR